MRRNFDWLLILIFIDFNKQGYEEGCMSPEAKDLIVKFLNPNPEKRLGTKGITEIKSHSFFSGLFLHTN